MVGDAKRGTSPLKLTNSTGYHIPSHHVAALSTLGPFSKVCFGHVSEASEVRQRQNADKTHNVPAHSNRRRLTHSSRSHHGHLSLQNQHVGRKSLQPAFLDLLCLPFTNLETSNLSLLPVMVFNVSHLSPERRQRHRSCCSRCSSPGRSVEGHSWSYKLRASRTWGVTTDRSPLQECTSQMVSLPYHRFRVL